MESASSLEDLVGNIDIAKQLVQFLSYEEQLNMSRVCKQFQNDIINFIWKHKYRNVEVIARHVIHAISNHLELKPAIKGLRKENWKLLKPQEFELFLYLNKSNIKHLKVWARFSFDDDRMYQAFAVNSTLQNLTSLNYFGVILSDNDLQMISHNCQRMDTLIIEDCVNIQKQVLVVGLDVNVATIANIKELKSFTLKSNCIYNSDMHIHNYTLVRNILRNLNIQKLYLNVAILAAADKVNNCGMYRSEVSDSAQNNIDDLQLQSNPCVELEIGQFHNNDDFAQFCKTFLFSCTNLCKLTVRGMLCSSNINVDKDFFATVNKNLGNLTSLNLSDCVVFHFTALNTLHELALHSCSNLTYNNLKQILSSKNIKSVTSLRTKYSGQLQYFPISQSLQKLEVDFKDRQCIKLFEQKLPNLHSLVWHGECNQTIDRPSLHMPNIEKLSASQGRLMATHELFHLKSLHTLTLSNCHSIREVLKLLHHSTLQQLTIGRYDEQVADVMDSKTIEQLVEDLRTNIVFLDIPMNLFRISHDFWLDLISTNGQLKLMASGYLIWKMNDTFMYNLINSNKFPTRIKTLQFCGFNIDCNDLKNYFSDVTKQMTIIKSIMQLSPKVPTLLFSDI